MLLWGDEVEYNVIRVDDATKTVRVALRAKELLAKLQEPENSGQKDLPSLWRPEYASYMVEGTPGIRRKSRRNAQIFVESYVCAVCSLDVTGPCIMHHAWSAFSGVPYGGLIDDFNEVEKNMKNRREEVMKLLEKDEIIVSMSIFPRYSQTHNPTGL